MLYIIQAWHGTRFINITVSRSKPLIAIVTFPGANDLDLRRGITAFPRGRVVHVAGVGHQNEFVAQTNRPADRQRQGNGFADDVTSLASAAPRDDDGSGRRRGVDSRPKTTAREAYYHTVHFNTTPLL